MYIARNALPAGGVRVRGVVYVVRYRNKAGVLTVASCPGGWGEGYGELSRSSR